MDAENLAVAAAAGEQPAELVTLALAALVRSDNVQNAAIAALVAAHQADVGPAAAAVRQAVTRNELVAAAVEARAEMERAAALAQEANEAAVAAGAPPQAAQAPPPGPGAGPAGEEAAGGDAAAPRYVAMTADQLAYLTARVRPAAAAARRPEKRMQLFSTGQGTDWRIWRRAFELTAGINLWTDDRARRELVTLIDGNAARMASDLHEESAATLPLLLLEYENRFLPAASSDIARMAFHKAEQAESESLLAWHARARDYFIRAYPQERNWATAHLLLERFISGLRELAVKQQTWRMRPANYNAALEHASNELAGLAMYAGEARYVKAGLDGLTVKREPELHAIGFQGRNPGAAGRGRGRAPAGGGKVCYNCGGAGHFKRDCPKPPTDAAPAGQDGQRAARGGRDQRGPQRGQRGQRGRRGGRQAVHHIGTGAPPAPSHSDIPADESSDEDWDAEN